MLPGQQRTGGFAMSLMDALGAPIRNQFGLRPGVHEDGTPAPYQLVAEDRHHLLDDVRHLNAHPHLPHFEPVGTSATLLEVLVRQVVSASAPVHPVMAPRSLFNGVLQARPHAGLGCLTVCDPTIWTSTNGGVSSLKVLWKNVCRGPEA